MTEQRVAETGEGAKGRGDDNLSDREVIYFSAGCLEEYSEFEPALFLLSRIVGCEEIKLDEFGRRGLSIILDSLVNKAGELEVSTRRLLPRLEQMKREVSGHGQ